MAPGGGSTSFGALLSASFLILCINISSSEVANITASSMLEPETCDCKELSCTCCQLIITPSIKTNNTRKLSIRHQNVCLQFTLKIIPISIIVNVQLNNDTIFTTTIDPKNPPRYCLPLVVPAVNACLQLRDVKLLDLTSVQICSTFYFDYQIGRVFEQTLPCLKLSASSGISVMA